MRTLIKYEIEFERVRDFINFTLTDANTLSSELLGLLDFKKGVFFTLLPEGSNIDKIFQFRYGGILPQNPIVTIKGEDHNSRYQITPNIRPELCKLIFNFLTSEQNAVCIFDDVTLTKDDYTQNIFFKEFGFLFSQEIYFLIKNNINLEKNIMECLRLSHSNWHSLCMISEQYPNEADEKTLTQENISHLCLKIKLLILGAYDGEGYIFWEPTSASSLLSQL